MGWRFGLLLLLIAAASHPGDSKAIAESLGGYVHGEMRIGDEDILFCVAGAHETAIEIARRHNGYVMAGHNQDGEDYQVFRMLSQQAILTRKCFRATRLDHRSSMTLYHAPESPEGDAVYSVVAGNYVNKDRWLSGYVLTFEKVPAP